MGLCTLMMISILIRHPPSGDIVNLGYKPHAGDALPIVSSPYWTIQNTP